MFARAVPKLLTHHTFSLTSSGRGNSMAFRSDTGIQTDGLSWVWLKGSTGVARCVFLGWKKNEHNRARFWLQKKLPTRPALLVLCSFTLKGRWMYFNCFFEKRIDHGGHSSFFSFSDQWLSEWFSGRLAIPYPPPPNRDTTSIFKKPNWFVQVCEPSKKHETKNNTKIQNNVYDPSQVYHVNQKTRTKTHCMYGGFQKWWYPTTMGFPTKNDHFGVFWGYHLFFQMSGIPSFHPSSWNPILPKFLLLEKRKTAEIQETTIWGYATADVDDISWAWTAWSHDGTLRFPVQRWIHGNSGETNTETAWKNTWRFLTKITRKSWWIEIICINNL